MSGIHAARVEKSARLRRALFVLNGSKTEGDGGIDGLELERLASVRAGGTVVSELRRNGHLIDCKYMGTTPRGGKVYRYFYHGMERK